MPALNEVYKVRWLCQQENQAGFLIMHWKVSAHNGTGATMGQVAQAFENLIAADLKGLISDSATFRGCGVQRIFPTPPTLEVISTAQAGPGIVINPALPKQTCALITLTTAFAGRKYRGRKYIPFPTEGHNTTHGKPEAAYLGFVTLLANKLIVGMTAGAGGNTDVFVPVIWHRATSTSDQVTSHVVRQVWATQRRRGDYGKTNLMPF